jgi:glycerophosphoryl diester phosphodiesterase
MQSVEIVAHRGVADHYPENTLQAFERAIELGADGVEVHTWYRNSEKALRIITKYKIPKFSTDNLQTAIAFYIS